MKTKNFPLPEWQLVAGETKARTIVIPNGENYAISDPGGASAMLYVYDFFDSGAKPVVTKNVPVRADGSSCVCEVRLTSSNTAQLMGKYIYLIRLTDGAGGVHKPRGILYASRGENVS